MSAETCGGYVPYSWEYYDDDPDVITHRFFLRDDRSAELCDYERYSLFKDHPNGEYGRVVVLHMIRPQAFKEACKTIKKILDYDKLCGKVNSRKDNDMTKITRKQITEIVEAIIDGKLTDATWDDAALLHEAIGHALEMHEKKRVEPEIYMAHLEGDAYIEGFFSGRFNDVRARIHPQYDLTEIEIEPVPAGYEKHRANLLAKKERLQLELINIEKRLESGDLGTGE